jgi:hypothetical protein
VSLRRFIAASVTVLVSCRGPTPPLEPPAPEETAASDSVTAPLMVPDPVAVTPEVTVTGVRFPDRERARRLVTEGRALVENPGGIDAAVGKFLDAIAADSLHGDAYWELGWAHQQRDEWDEGLQAWQSLRRIDSAYPGLARHLPILEMRRDRAAARDTLASGTPLAPEEEPRHGTSIRIAAVGDIQLGRSWPEDNPILPPDNAAPMFSRVDHWLRAADITFGNLETVLADSGQSTKCRRGSRNCYAFRAPTGYARTLRRVGFDVLSVNNNHAGDFGGYGRRATERSLDRTQIRHAGPTSGVASWETHGLRIALLAFSTGSGPYRVQDIDTARAQVMAADREHDLVIVSFHGGAEGSGATRIPKTTETAYGEDRGDVYAFSRAMVDAGADLVLGHGPHVLRGMEIYRGRLIAYSLGNFSAWHGFNLTGPLGLSAVLNVTLAINGVVTAAEINPVFLDDPGVPTPDPERRAVDIVRRLSRDDLGNAVFDEAGRYRRRR